MNNESVRIPNTAYGSILRDSGADSGGKKKRRIASLILFTRYSSFPKITFANYTIHKQNFLLIINSSNHKFVRSEKFLQRGKVNDREIFPGRYTVMAFFSDCVASSGDKITSRF